MKRYEELIKKCGIETYFITETNKKSIELFFIKKKLDMKRMKEVDSVTISVMKDTEENGKKLRGRSDVFANSSMSDEEIISKIKQASFSADYAMNPFFNLPKAVKSEKKVMESDLNGMPLSEIAKKFADALYSADNDSEAFINSFELFVKEEEVHMISSTGADVSYVRRIVSGEFVAQCKEPMDVETYKDFEYDSLALEEFADFVRAALKMTKDRAKASKMPKAGTYDIVLSDSYVGVVMSFYAERALSAYIYQGYSNFKVGDKVQGADVKGDSLNIRFGVSVPFNEEAIEMKERDFISDGELKTIHGSQRFCDYLGIEQIGTYDKIIIPKGKVSLDELTSRPCLHIVNFSDFQMDAFSGFFAGEIRLAYLYDGKGNVECVSGGSINGSILDAQKDLHFSSEMQKKANYVGPKACLLTNISVAGE